MADDRDGIGQEQEAYLPVRGNLRKVFEAHRGERHIVVVQDFPDPDAISSAFTHQLLSEQFEIDVDIAYSGVLSHQQNVALVKLLGISLVKYHPSLDLSQYNGAVFVDNQGTTSEEIVAALEKAGVPAVMVVDHHKPQNRLKPEFSDIRETGATASIYSEYLQQGLLQLDKTNRSHVIAATALMHGIMTDTGGFIHAKAADFGAAAFLSEYTDPDLIGQVLSQARTRQVMEIIRQALGNRVIAESFSIAGIGYLRADDRDAIPQAADFLLTEENIHTAIVYGIVARDDGEERLIGSMRTLKITIDPDEFIKVVFGKGATGDYFGGGKLSAGGFEIPIGFLSGGLDEEYSKLKWQVYDSQIKHKLFTKIDVKKN